MEKLTMTDFDEVYQLFQKAFIPEELRPYEKMKCLFQQQRIIIYGYKSEQKIISALLVWELENCIYWENFAVDESMRGQGLGGRALEEVKALYPNQLIILEVEKPFDDMSKRRIGFYQRHDFILNPFSYIQPTLDVNPTQVCLQLMSFPHSLEEVQYQKIKQELFEVVYNQKERTMYCSHCGKEVREHDRFCTSCGEKLTVINHYCSNCGHEIDLSLKYCSHCGYEIPRIQTQVKKRKSKIVAGILGILLGGLGIHNFYIGETSKGIIQLCLFCFGFLTLGITSLVSEIWGCVEGVCILVGYIDKDGDDYPLE